MNTVELTGLLKKITRNTHFLGVLASDQLPNGPIARLPALTIINTHPSTKSGEHWLAVYITGDGVGRFFDSFGNKPDFLRFPPSISDFLKTTCDRVEYSTKQFQDSMSTTCGQHCIFFLYHMVKGSDYEDVMFKYSDNLLKNDAMVSLFVKKLLPCSCKENVFSCVQHVQSGEMFVTKKK